MKTRRAVGLLNPIRETTNIKNIYNRCTSLGQLIGLVCVGFLVAGTRTTARAAFDTLRWRLKRPLARANHTRRQHGRLTSGQRMVSEHFDMFRTLSNAHWGSLKSILWWSTTTYHEDGKLPVLHLVVSVHLLTPITDSRAECMFGMLCFTVCDYIIFCS